MKNTWQRHYSSAWQDIVFYCPVCGIETMHPTPYCHMCGECLQQDQGDENDSKNGCVGERRTIKG